MNEAALEAIRNMEWMVGELELRLNGIDDGDPIQSIDSIKEQLEVVEASIADSNGDAAEEHA